MLTWSACSSSCSNSRTGVVSLAFRKDRSLTRSLSLQGEGEEDQCGAIFLFLDLDGGFGSVILGVLVVGGVVLAVLSTFCVNDRH